MKKIGLLIIGIAVLFNVTNGQNSAVYNIPVNEETGLVTFEGVITVEGFTKDQLYENAISWFEEFYKNPLSVFKEKDAEAGKIKGRHRIKIFRTENEKQYQAHLVRYDISLFVKEGKFKYTLTNFKTEATKPIPIETWLADTAPDNGQSVDYLRQVDMFSKELVESLINRLKSDNVVKDEDDW
ncbi:MAG: DUF4468 domain-containing protein [Bacteroidetes bacterium]|nr:DUF4468 domain-containing protein [Bacteroidota bacterium]